MQKIPYTIRKKDSDEEFHIWVIGEEVINKFPGLVKKCVDNKEYSVSTGKGEFDEVEGQYIIRNKGSDRELHIQVIGKDANKKFLELVEDCIDKREYKVSFITKEELSRGILKLIQNK